MDLCPSVQELLILLWKLLEENPAFMPHILKRHDITQLVVPICYLIFDARRDTAKVGALPPSHSRSSP